MKVPKYMIEKMHKANALISEGNKLVQEIMNYYEEKGAAEKTLDKIRELEIPHYDCTDEIIEMLKSEV